MYQRNFMKYAFLLVFFAIPSLAYAESEQILITSSQTMNDVIIDGIWTFSSGEFPEWKQSSYDDLKFEKERIVLRSAHQGDYVYFLIDFVTDTSHDSGLDKSLICFDTKNNKSIKPDSDDFCFMSVLNKQTGHVLHGGTDFPQKNFMKKYENSTNYVGMGGVSNQHDRYSKIPHTSYEFKIPTDVIGRNNVYGFYFEVYDYNLDRTFTWPQNLSYDGHLKIPSPSKWGEIMSPDRTLPEFEFPILLVIVSMTALFVLPYIKGMNIFPKLK